MRSLLADQVLRDKALGEWAWEEPAWRPATPTDATGESAGASAGVPEDAKAATVDVDLSAWPESESAMGELAVAEEISIVRSPGRRGAA